MKGKSAREIARAFAINYAIIVDNLSLVGEENETSIVVEGWPREDSLSFFGISQEILDDMWINLPKPYEEYLEMQFEGKRDGNKITLTFKT